MKLVSFFFLLLYSPLLHAGPIPTDTLQNMLKRGEYDAVIENLTISGKQHQIKNGYPTNPGDQILLLIAKQAKGDTLTTLALQKKLLAASPSQEQEEENLKLLFNLGFKFVTTPSVYFFIQEFGEQLAEKYQKPRAQFSFLQQQFSMRQMTGQPGDIPAILRKMKHISTGYDYLLCLTNMHYGLYYSGLKNDSCTYYFENFLACIDDFMGKPNPYFLNERRFAAKKDSGMVASSIGEYARHYMRKGDLKKAGELLILSEKHVPDTSSFSLLKVQNQITLAAIYADLVNPAKAEDYMTSALAICETYALHRLRDTHVAAAHAYVLMSNHRYAEAASAAETAYSNFAEGMNLQYPQKQALRVALCKTYLEDYSGAKRWLDSANVLKTNTDPETNFLLLMVMGEIASGQHQYDLSRISFYKASWLATAARAIGWEKEALYRLYLSEKKGGNHSKSLSILESYAQLNDSLYRTGQDVALFEIESAYQKNLQDEAIAKLDAQNEASGLKLHAQELTLWTVIVGMGIMSVLLIWLYRLYDRVKTANQIISKVVQEKNILLREIHHRVKNNLQVISSLLKLQSGYIQDEVAVQAIAEGRSRVQSMALLHQNLYKEDNVTGVNMKDYFDNLIQGLFDTYNISADRITLHKNIEDITLDVDTVVPLGLITNELISNALKHAFPGNLHGNLYVDLFEKSGNLILHVRDDGTGISYESRHEGFGSKLIQLLSQKLEADITTRSSHGTDVILTIREYRKAA